MDQQTRLLGYFGHELLLPDIVRAENARLYDAAGNVYVDMASGVWCVSVGHGNQAVTHVLTEQAAALVHAGFSFSSPKCEQAAQTILELFGYAEGGKCTFLCSGSEAIEYGVRLARMITHTLADKPLFLTMADSYFGAYGAAHAKGEEQWRLLNWTQCAECDAVTCDDTCGHFAAIPFGRIGAFVFEPGSSSGFVRFPPEKLISAITGSVRENGGLVLVNEVTTGVGRTGKWFGYQHYDLAPDIVMLGKGVGNGYPVSVCAVSPRVVDALGGRPVPYIQSHQNDPLGAAVAAAVVTHIRDNGLMERSAGLSEKLLTGLSDIRQDAEAVTDVRGRGMMAAVDLEGGPGFGRCVQRALVERGYLVCCRPGENVLRLDPPLTIDESDIAGCIDAMREVLVAGSR